MSQLEEKVEETKQNVQTLQQEKEDLMKKLPKEIALPTLNWSKVFGKTNVSSIQSWPSETELRAMTKKTLNSLKFTKVEWYAGAYLHGIRFTLSDGSVSPQIGKSALNNSFEFPQNRPIKIIRVRTYDN